MARRQRPGKAKSTRKKGYRIGGRIFASKASYKRSKLFRKRSASAKKAARTRRRRELKAQRQRAREKRSEAARKGWRSRRERQARRREVAARIDEIYTDEATGIMIFPSAESLLALYPNAEKRPRLFPFLEDAKAYIAEIAGAAYFVLVRVTLDTGDFWQPYYVPDLDPGYRAPKPRS
jgi:hypothetical protein